MTQNKINHDFPADKKPWTQIAILAVNKPIQINASQKYNKKKHPNGHHAHCLMLSNQ